MNDMNTAVILPAAGLGSRFSAGDRAASSKIDFELGGKAVFLHAIDLFHGRGDVAQIILAINPDQLDEFSFRWGEQLTFLGVELIPGAKEERWATVKAALESVVHDEVTHIAVHDAARPCTPTRVIDGVFAAAMKHGAAVPGVPVSDTLKQVESIEGEANTDPIDAILGTGHDGAAHLDRVVKTIDRAALVGVQTPQVFERQLLVDAYAGVDAANAAGLTDDASVVERAGLEVVVVPGDRGNLKLTQGEDAEMLEALLNHRKAAHAKALAVKDLFGDDDD